MKIVDPNEGLLVKAFVKELHASPFSESLYRISPKTLMEIRQRAAVEIEIEEALRHKRSGDKRLLINNENERTVRPFRKERTPPRKMLDRKFVSYLAQKRNELHRVRRMPTLKVAPSEVLEYVEITKHLRYPSNTGKILNSRPNSWCRFHQVGGHDTDSCYTLANQLSTLLDRGLMKKYVKINIKEKPILSSATELHEEPILGDFNIIAGGFARGGQTSLARKRYVRSIMTTTKIERPKKVPDNMFLSEDLKGVVPHEDDLIVLSVITMGRNVLRVLVDKGSLANVIFWNAFVGLQIPIDHLQPFDGVLVGFSGDQVEVRGYVDLWTTFRDKEVTKTIFVRYILVNAPLSYNLLLGGPSTNKLGAVISTVHLKMKFPTDDGMVVTMAVNQEIDRKCYEDSLKAR